MVDLEERLRGTYSTGPFGKRDFSPYIPAIQIEAADRIAALEAENKSLKADNEAMKHDIAEYVKTSSEQATKIIALEADRERLVEAYLRRSTHCDMLAKAAHHTNIWLAGALECESFEWSQDQKLYAQQAVDDLYAALAAAKGDR